MNLDKIRAEAIEVLARTDFARFCKTATWEEVDESDRATWISPAEALVDALAEAGLLPTGEQFGVGGDGAPCCIHEDEHAARLDQTTHGGPLRHRWTHNWQVVDGRAPHVSRDKESK